MKQCACCWAECPAAQPTCSLCGEASWYELPEPTDDKDKQDAPPEGRPVKRGRSK